MTRARVLVVLEGVNDIEFLRRISAMLHDHDPRLPDLARWERQGKLVFLPFGGGSVQGWLHRLAPLHLPEFHLFDHELPPETELRHAAAAIVNQRDRCQAVVTRKRSLENYLHDDAVRESAGIDISIGDFDSVAELAARAQYEQGQDEMPWELLPRRAKARMLQRAKRWLNLHAVKRMTPDRLAQRDPDGELISWLESIRQLSELSADVDG